MLYSTCVCVCFCVSHICLLECSHSHLAYNIHQTTTVLVQKLLFVCILYNAYTMCMFDIKLVRRHFTALAQYSFHACVFLLFTICDFHHDGCLGDEWRYMYTSLWLTSVIIYQRYTCTASRFYCSCLLYDLHIFSCNFPWLGVSISILHRDFACIYMDVVSSLFLRFFFSSFSFLLTKQNWA